VVAYLIHNDDYGDGQSVPDSGMPFKLKLKIFPPYNLENPDVV